MMWGHGFGGLVQKRKTEKKTNKQINREIGKGTQNLISFLTLLFSHKCLFCTFCIHRISILTTLR